MKEKMTSGELAKRTGVSQKAIRLYDEKGLLRPTAYSEGNYRLYDEEALFTLEKIIALKQVGFSLDEIRENLIFDEGMDIQTSLRQQIQLLYEKKKQLESSIACLENALKRCSGQNDWDSVAEALRNILINQAANERYQYYQEQKSGAWYPKIYRSLRIESGQRILDLGCGRGLLWLQNREALPQNIRVDAVDLHGSGADSFAQELEKSEEVLPPSTAFHFWWQDVEEESLWEQLAAHAPYQRVIAHYFLHFLRDEEKMLSRIARILAPDGLFSCNGPCVSREYGFWEEWLQKHGIDAGFVSAKIKERKKREGEFLKKLQRHFSTVKSVELSNDMKYEQPEALLKRLLCFFPDQKKALCAERERILAYAGEELDRAGIITVPISMTFRHCFALDREKVKLSYD